MIGQLKIKKLCVFCSFCLLLFLVVQCSLFCVPSYASETDTQTVDEYLQENNFYDVCSWICRNYCYFPDGVTGGFLYEQFIDYLEQNDKTALLDEDVVITGSGGGRGYDIPQDVRQEILNFVQNTYVEENPLSYVGCYISSYKFLDTSWIGSYYVYTSIQTAINIITTNPRGV